MIQFDFIIKNLYCFIWNSFLLKVLIISKKYSKIGHANLNEIKNIYFAL